MVPTFSRRVVLERGAAVAALVTPLSVLGPPALSGTAVSQEAPGLVLQEDEGEYLISGRRRAPMRVKIDSRRMPGVRMSMVVSVVPPAAAIPVHRHHNEDELIFIHAGEGVLTLGDRQVPVSAGAMLYGPRNVWHGVENTGEEALTWCAIFSPAGFEQYFREVGVPPGQEGRLPPADQVNRIAAKYGLEFRDA